MKEQSIDEVVKIKPEVIDRISEIDPSVTTSVDAAKFLKNEFDKECRGAHLLRFAAILPELAVHPSNAKIHSAVIKVLGITWRCIKPDPHRT